MSNKKYVIVGSSDGKKWFVVRCLPNSEDLLTIGDINIKGNIIAIGNTPSEARDIIKNIDQ